MGNETSFKSGTYYEMVTPAEGSPKPDDCL